jgi:hypothetical protein
MRYLTMTMVAGSMLLFAGNALAADNQMTAPQSGAAVRHLKKEPLPE